MRTLYNINIEEIKRKSLQLFGKMHTSSSVSYFSEFTGCNSSIGENFRFNTIATAKQLFFAIALSQSPLVDNIIDNPDENIKEIVDEMHTSKSLKGIKILDLGCGKIPVFARCSRELGAEVYTIDIIDAEEFLFFKECFPPLQRQIEIQTHLKIDLNIENVAEEIIRFSKGHFNLVTSSFLESGSFYESHKFICPPFNIDEIALSLLSQNSIYYKCSILDKICIKN